MIRFLNLLPPSLKFRIIKYQFYQNIDRIQAFNEKSDVIDNLLGKLSLQLYEPMYTIMHQFEKFNQIIIVGEGKVQACKYVNKLINYPLGQIPQSVLIGDIPFFFGTPAIYSVQTFSYCNIGVIYGSKFNKLIKECPSIKTDMMKEILSNPYD